KLALKYHPDKTQGCAELEHKFKEVQEAYEVLSDSQKRHMHDVGADDPHAGMGGMGGMGGGMGGMGGMGGIDPEILMQMFGGGAFGGGGSPFGVTGQELDPLPLRLEFVVILDHCDHHAIFQDANWEHQVSTAMAERFSGQERQLRGRVR
ncbi:hypothetical protein BC828DRAFT_408809, partial [Blastocladiella britannica]